MEEIISISNLLETHQKLFNDQYLSLEVYNTSWELIHSFGKVSTEVLEWIGRSSKNIRKPFSIKLGDQKCVLTPTFSRHGNIIGYVLLTFRDNIQMQYIWSIVAELISIIMTYKSSQLKLSNETEFFEFGKFTVREIEVINELKTGYKDKTIAQNLCMSIPTVRKHLNSIYQKSNVESRSEFIANYYIELINNRS